MATVTAGYNWVSGETVTPAKLNSAAAPTVVLADGEVTNAKLATGIDASKITTGTLPIARIADGAIAASKLDGAQTGSAPIYGCRAWVNFDGNRDSTGASNTNNTNRFIRASGNVSSVLRTATGTYTVTFTTAMPDANYSSMATAGSGDAAQIFTAAVENTASSSAIVYTADSGFRSNFNFGTPADLNAVSVAIFR
jgi:hypothetical protein